MGSGAAVWGTELQHLVTNPRAAIFRAVTRLTIHDIVISP